VRPDGKHVILMPSEIYSNFNDDEVGSIIAYLRSLKPIGAPTPEPSFGLFVRTGIVLGVFKTPPNKPPLDVGPQYERGRHLGLIACAECHMTDFHGQPKNSFIPAPDLSLVASYERGDFFKLMRTGKAAGNRELGMMSQTARHRFTHFTDDEINAIYDYLVARGNKLTSAAN
jgi:cytochrome c553